jgi:hypothetical protein
MFSDKLIPAERSHGIAASASLLNMSFDNPMLRVALCSDKSVMAQINGFDPRCKIGDSTPNA